ncbi:IS66 family transposase [Candidatus Accumulibacter contiguus]|jgi:transposase|nr:IS66 family transposase [Accumulibacter sp.]
MSRQRASHRKRPAHNPPQRMVIPVQEIEAIVEHSGTRPLTETEQATLKAAVDTLARLTAELETKETTLARLRRILFGAPTERTAHVLGEGKKGETPPADTPTRPSAEGGDEQAAGQAPSDTTSPESGVAEPKKKRPGHGRNGAADYPRAPHIAVPHATLRHGDPCPVDGCTGRVYGQRGEPAVLVRITGVAPLLAEVYELERLRCGLCGTVFTADPPPGVGKAKYDDSAAAMIALLKYGCGLPFHRIERLEQGLAIPMPVGTQWEVVAAAAAPLMPVFDELARQAAQGTVVYNDDTAMRILTLTQEARAEALPAGASADRTGVFTSGVVAETPNGLIALFKTGPCHAGEHLAEVLDLREVTDPPIHMSDASTRNRPGDHSTLSASCIPHARRNYVDVVEAFPEEVAFVLHTLRAVFHTDAQAKQQGLSPAERLLLHQKESGPRMKALQDWMAKQFAEHTVEPHSGLGQAIAYMQNHWEKLTLFLRVPGAPLDNNITERILKKAILHRKNALFYRTLNGARVGDLFMTLIHTAELHKIEPFHYLVSLLRHSGQVALDPAAWMPWNYSEALAHAEAESTEPPPD